MARKIFWFDCETTGLDPIKNDIIELACIVEIDGEVKASKLWRIQPQDYSAINEEALKVNQLTLEQIKTFDTPTNVHKELVDFLSFFIDRYDPKDKFYIGGYNVDFDLQFLKCFFEKNNDKYFGSFFNYRKVDPLAIIRYLEYYEILYFQLENHKLETVAIYFQIPLKPHSALDDIYATRNLSEKLRSYIQDRIRPEGGDKCN